MKTLCITLSMLLSHASYAQLDLHAHLDMKPGTGWLLSGDFNLPPVAKEWNSRAKTKASQQSLLEAGAPQLMAVSFYAHPYFSRPFSFDLHANVQAGLEAEYQSLIRFQQDHADLYIIAKTSTEAKAALEKGKRVLVLSIEGAENAIDRDEDYQKWIKDRGVAIVTPFHLTEDDLGGAAFMQNLIAQFNGPLSFIKSVMASSGKCLLDYCRSPVGMSEKGHALIQKLWQDHVWVDLAHANELEIAALIPELKSRGLPLLVTHTQLRETYPSERAFSPIAGDYLSLQGGIIGLVPSDDMLPKPLDQVAAEACDSGLARFKQSVQEARKRYGENKIALGSDINAPLKGLSPLCTFTSGQVPSDLEKNGFYTYAQSKALFDFVSTDPGEGEKMVQQFVSLWQQVQSSR